MVHAPQEASLVAELPELGHVRRLLGSKVLSLQGYDTLLRLLAEPPMVERLADEDEAFWLGLLTQTQAALQLVPPREAGALLRKLAPLWEVVWGAYGGPATLSMGAIRLRLTPDGLVMEGEFKHMALRLFRKRDCLLVETMARGALKGNKGEGYVAGICQDQEVWVTQRQSEFLSRAGICPGYGGIKCAAASAEALPLAELEAPLQAALQPFVAVTGEAIAFDWLVAADQSQCRVKAALFWEAADGTPLSLELLGIAEADSLLKTGRALLAQRLLPELRRRLAERFGARMAERVVNEHAVLLVGQLSRLLVKGVPLAGGDAVLYLLEEAVRKVLEDIHLEGQPLEAWVKGQLAKTTS